LKVLNDDVYERDVTDRQELFIICQTHQNKNGEVAGLCFKEYFRIILPKTLMLKIPFVWDMRRRVTG